MLLKQFINGATLVAFLFKSLNHVSAKRQCFVGLISHVSK